MVAENQFQVPDDFDVPQVSDEQIQEMMKNSRHGRPEWASPDGDERPAGVNRTPRRPRLKRASKQYRRTEQVGKLTVHFHFSYIVDLGDYRI